MNDQPIETSELDLSYEQTKVHRGGHQFLDNSMGDERNVFYRFYDKPDRYEFGSVGIRCGVNTSNHF